jgi:hypothetical protein
LRRSDDTDIFYLKLLGFEFPIDGKSPGFRPTTDFSKGRKEPRLLLALLQRRPGELCLLRPQKLRRRSTCRTSHPYPPHQAGQSPTPKTFPVDRPAARSLAGQPLKAWFTAQVQADLQERGTEAHLINPQTSPDGHPPITGSDRDRTGQNWTAVYAAAHARPDRAQICSMISDLLPQEMKPYIRSGATIFGETVKQAHGGPSLSPLKDDNSHGMGGPLDL